MSDQVPINLLLPVNTRHRQDLGCCARIRINMHRPLSVSLRECYDVFQHEMLPHFETAQGQSHNRRGRGISKLQIIIDSLYILNKLSFCQKFLQSNFGLRGAMVARWTSTFITSVIQRLRVRAPPEMLLFLLLL